MFIIDEVSLFPKMRSKVAEVINHLIEILYFLIGVVLVRLRGEGMLEVPREYCGHQNGH